MKQPTIPELIRGIARRVLAEQECGSRVDLARLRWARDVVAGRQPEVPQRAESRAGEPA